jgi:hypothetical protein
VLHPNSSNQPYNKDIMTLKKTSKPSDRPCKLRLNLLWNHLEFSATDLYTIALFALFCLYLGWTNPVVLWVGAIACLIAISFGLFQKGLNFALAWNLPIRPWQVASVVLALTAVFGEMPMPAHAQFFDSLEKSLTDVVTEADTGIDESIIKTIFVFFRVLMVLAFIIGVIIVFIQATRGNDWQPIANLLAIGVAFVIGVEVITKLMLGDGAGGTG